jgi:hypothetical protein
VTGPWNTFGVSASVSVEFQKGQVTDLSYFAADAEAAFCRFVITSGGTAITVP